MYIYVYKHIYVCIYTGAWISQTHLGTHTADEHYLMPVWSDGNFHLSLQLVLQLRVQTPKWPSESRGVGSLLTQHSLCTGGLILSHQPQPPNQSPQSPQRDLIPLSKQSLQSCCAITAHSGQFHTHTHSSAALQLHTTVPVWHSHSSPDTATSHRLWSAHCHVQKLQPLLKIAPQESTHQEVLLEVIISFQELTAHLNSLKKMVKVITWSYSHCFVLLKTKVHL